MDTSSRKRKFPLLDTNEHADEDRTCFNEIEVSKSTAVVRKSFYGKTLADVVSKDLQAMNILGSIADCGLAMVHYMSNKLTNRCDEPSIKKRRVDPVSQKLEAKSGRLTVVEDSDDAEYLGDSDENLNSPSYVLEDDGDIVMDRMKPSSYSASGRPAASASKDFQETESQNEPSRKSSKRKLLLEVDATYLETLDNLNAHIRSEKNANKILQDQIRDQSHKHLQTERHLQDKIERLMSERDAARSEVKHFEKSWTQNYGGLAYGMNNDFQKEFHEVCEDNNYYREEIGKLEAEYSQMLKKFNAASNKSIKYEQRKLVDQQTISKLNDTILHLNSQLGFYEEKDDTFFDSAFSKLETGIRNWVVQNFKGATQLPFELTILPVFRFQEGPQEYDRKEISSLLKNYVMHEVHTRIMNVIHCSLEDDVLYGMKAVEKRVPQGSEYLQWRSKTLRMLLKDQVRNDTMETRIRRQVNVIEHAIGKYATSSSSEMSRREGLYKIAEDAATLAHEIKMLAKSEILLKWPISGLHFDPDRMETSTGEEADPNATIEGALFPEVIKLTYDKNGLPAKFSLRKAAVLMPSAKLKNEFQNMSGLSSSASGIVLRIKKEDYIID